MRLPVAVLLAAVACGPSTPARRSDAAPVRRLVILAPSLTEIAFALGRGDRVVGVDTFSRYPAAAARLPKVGGLVDPSLEGILALAPDLVLLSSAASSLDARLRAAGVRARVLRCESLGDLRADVAALGEILDARPAAEALTARLDRELDAVRRATTGRPRPRVLYVFDRQPGAIRDVFAAGRRSFLHELLGIAGGANVFGDEALLAARPEVVFDATADPAGLAPWQAVPELPAVRTGRVVATADPVFTIPGPRVGEVARRMARAIHPEAVP